MICVFKQPYIALFIILILTKYQVCNMLFLLAMTLSISSHNVSPNGLTFVTYCDALLQTLLCNN